MSQHRLEPLSVTELQAMDSYALQETYNDAVHKHNALSDELDQKLTSIGLQETYIGKLKDELQAMTHEANRVSNVMDTQSHLIDNLKQELSDTKKQMSSMRNPMHDIVEQLLRTELVEHQVRNYIADCLSDAEDLINDHIGDKVTDIVDNLRIEVRGY
jgi:chromosome segregation ATPase